MAAFTKEDVLPPLRMDGRGGSALVQGEATKAGGFKDCPGDRREARCGVTVSLEPTLVLVVGWVSCLQTLLRPHKSLRVSNRCSFLAGAAGGFRVPRAQQ